MKKRYLGLFMALLLTLTLFPVNAAASDIADSFSLTHNQKENIKFVLEKDQLTVAGLPDSAAFGSVWVNIVNTGGKVQISQIVDRNPDATASLSLKKLKGGDYCIELFINAGNGQYKSYIFGNELRFNWKSGKGAFLLPPTYEHNKKTYEAGRSDDAALAHYLKHDKSIQCTDERIIKQAQEITNEIDSDYGKAFAIHKWVCDNIWYDWDIVGKGKWDVMDAVSALGNRRTLCTGYANLTAALLRAVGIPAKIVSGHGRLSSGTGVWTESQLSGKETNHYWNEAYVDGRWIIIDSTWDSGNDYKGEKKTSSGGLYYNRYFDATVEAFSLNHYINPYQESSIPPPPELSDPDKKV